ncbi:hypothetical protein [Brevibacterium casei]|uniref:hypothetical protein n=1 Tax=Brevibacterium casei TaxID=33889 RepID=UPI003EBAC0F7
MHRQSGDAVIARRALTSIPWAAWFVAGPLALVTLATLAIVLGGSFVTVPAAAGTCAASIDETITVAEVGGSGEFAPSEFERAFPEVPGLLAPGATGSDELSIRSIAEAPVAVTLIVESQDSPVANIDHDLRVTITWAGTIAATGTYSQVVGERIPLGTIEPQAQDILRVDVELPAVAEEDNDTQDRTWPLRFDLGVQADTECESDRTDDRADSDSRGGSDATDDSAGEAASAEGSSSNGDDAHVDGTDTAEGSALPRTGIGGLGVIALAAFVLAFAGFLLVAAARRRSSGGPGAADSEGEDLR